MAVSHNVVIALRFASSSLSSHSTTPRHRHHQHFIISMHQPSASSSRSSSELRSFLDTHSLSINSVCNAFGTSLHFTHSAVHSCLPLSHAGPPTPQVNSHPLAVSSASRDASVLAISETRRLRTAASCGLVTRQQPPFQGYDTTALLAGLSQSHLDSISSRYYRFGLRGSRSSKE